MDPSIEEVVKRVVARIANEPKSVPAAVRSAAPTMPPAGAPPDSTPTAGEPPAAAPAERPLIVADAVQSLARGSVVELADDAIVTPLAADLARERSIVWRRIPGSTRRSTVALGADHAGFHLKERLARWLESQQYRVLDLGAHGETPCDYPDFALAVARAIASGNCAFGVMVDGAGIGSSMVGNRVAGVLAANCDNVAAARNAREHNLANMLTLGARGRSEAEAIEIVRVFLATPDGEARHRRRVEKIRRLDRTEGGAR